MYQIKTMMALIIALIHIFASKQRQFSIEYSFYKEISYF